MLKARNIIIGFITFIALCSCGQCTQCNMNECMNSCRYTCGGGVYSKANDDCLNSCQSKCLEFYKPLSQDNK